MSNMTDMWLSGMFFKLYKYSKTRLSAGAPTRTMLGELTTPPRRLRRFDLGAVGAFGASVVSPPNTNSWLRLCFGWGLRTPNLGKRTPYGGEGWHRSKERWGVPIGLHKNFSSICVSDILSLLRFSTPLFPATSSVPKNFSAFLCE